MRLKITIEAARDRRAFVRIDLLVVVAIIAILTGQHQPGPDSVDIALSARRLGGGVNVPGRSYHLACCP